MKKLLTITTLLFSIATPALAEDLYLKCDGTYWGDEPWKNITFVKIHPEKGQALVQDQEEDNLPPWVLHKLISFKKESIILARCDAADCSKVSNIYYMLDRITGRMASGSFLTLNETGTQQFYGQAFWSCSEVKAAF